MNRRLVRIFVVTRDWQNDIPVVTEYKRVTDRPLKDCLFELPSYGIAPKAETFWAEDSRGHFRLLKTRCYEVEAGVSSPLTATVV